MAYEIVLDVLEVAALDRLRHGNARLPKNWSSIKIYERLVERGLAKELNTESPFLRVFTREASDGSN